MSQSKDISTALLKAFETMNKNNATQAQTSNVIECAISAVVDNAAGIYTVQYQNSSFNVYSLSSSSTPEIIKNNGTPAFETISRRITRYQRGVPYAVRNISNPFSPVWLNMTIHMAIILIISKLILFFIIYIQQQCILRHPDILFPVSPVLYSYIEETHLYLIHLLDQ